MVLPMHIAAYYHEMLNIVRAGTWIEDAPAEISCVQRREKRKKLLTYKLAPHIHRTPMSRGE